MIKNNMPLGICAGFVILAFCSCFFEVPTQTITTLSICSLLFTISQALQSFLTMRDEEFKTRFDANKILNNVDIDEKLELLFKHYFTLVSPNKKVKAIRIISYGFEILGIAILIVGLTVPIDIFTNAMISNICTFLSFAFLFLSIWVMDLIKNRIQIWNDLKLFAVLFKKDSAENNINHNKENIDNG